MRWIVPLSLLITFELVADLFAKQWSLGGRPWMSVAAIASYVVANIFWLIALRGGSGLARGALIFSVSTGIIAMTVGLVLYKEHVTRYQFAGALLGLMSIALLCWPESA